MVTHAGPFPAGPPAAATLAASENGHYVSFAHRVLALYAGQIEAQQVTAVREYTRGLAAVQADPEHLYRALVNLVGNALDAMEGGGRLTLRAGWGAGPELLRPAAARLNERRLKVEVEDTGLGIPAAVTAKVFNPFFTTKPSGTGLGLALTHKIIEDHGGTIRFRSTPGVRTTFTVLLPVRVERWADPLRQP
jgi:signal transduction histidine kinase